MLLCRHSVGTYPETSSHATCQGTFSHMLSQLAELLWTDPGIKSAISVHDLFSTLKKKKKAQVGCEWSNLLPKSLHAWKKPPPPPPPLYDAALEGSLLSLLRQPENFASSSSIFQLPQQ